MNTYYKPQAFFPVVPEGGLFGTSTSARTRLGIKIWDIKGNAYRYVKANEAIAAGELVQAVAEAAWDTTVVTDGAVAAGDTKIHIDTNTSAFTANQYAGYFIGQASAAAKGALYEIKGHNSVAASDEVDIILVNAVDEAISDGVALRIFNPYLMELTDGATERVDGVAIGAIASASYGWIQVGGIVPAVKVTGSSGNPTVVDEPIVPYASTAGTGQGRDGSGEADIVEMGLSPLIALRASAVDASYVPAKFTQEV